VERGGEVTYHGPGQLVAYPIVALLSPDAAGVPAAPVGVRRPLGVRAYVEALEAAMADTCAAAGIVAGQREGHPGCWVEAGGILPRKIGSLGIRVARGVTYHGIALNVTHESRRLRADRPLRDAGAPDDLAGPRASPRRHPGRRRGWSAGHGEASPPRPRCSATALARRLGFVLAGDLPPRAGAAGERRAIDRLVDELRHATPRDRRAGAHARQAGAS